MNATRPSPPTSALTEPYWDAARAGRLDIQRCTACGDRPFPPRRTCPACGGTQLHWETVSGSGTVHTFTIAHRPPHRTFVDQLPLVVAVVHLDEGPRMTTNIVGCEPDDVHVGMRVAVDFLPINDGGQALPVFTPDPGDDA